MGCDIHLWVETRRNGMWECVEDLEYDERNYDLFAILADVRNGVGFAGVETGEGFEPISAPRGVPKDASKEFQAHENQWRGDAHSHSWVSLAEILGTDWSAKRSVLSGVIDWAAFLEWRKTNRKTGPTSYSGAVWGGGTRVVEEAEADRQIVSGTQSPPTHVRVKWSETYQECMQDFLDWILECVVPLGKPEDVRMVFFFDN